MGYFRGLGVWLLLLLGACNTAPTGTVDAASAVDAEYAPDTADGLDAADTPDAVSRLDAANTPDAAGEADSGHMPDGANELDASSVVDAQVGLPCDPLDAESCVDDFICVQGHCAPAYDRPYRLTIVSGAVREHDGAGNGWDGRNGAPDPGVLVHFDDQLAAFTRIHDNTYAPSFNEVFELPRVFPDSEIKIELIDDDGGGGGGEQPWQYIWRFNVLVTSEQLRIHGTGPRMRCIYMNCVTYILQPLPAG